MSNPKKILCEKCGKPHFCFYVSKDRLADPSQGVVSDTKAYLCSSCSEDSAKLLWNYQNKWLLIVLFICLPVALFIALFAAMVMTQQ